MMEVLEQLGVLHNALQPDTPAADLKGWRDVFRDIRKVMEADPSTDRYDRETLEVIAAKFDALVAEVDAGAEEPDLKPTRTWVAALGTAVHRRLEAAKASALKAGKPH